MTARFPLICFVILLGLSAFAAEAQTRLPTVGGAGGGPFESLCPVGVLRGAELRTGDDVDAIRPICSLVDPQGGLGRETIVEPWRGGTGGEVRRLICPGRMPAVVGAVIEAEGDNTTIVNQFTLICGRADGSTSPPAAPQTMVEFIGPRVTPSEGLFVNFTIFVPPQTTLCPQGEVAVGIHGRHGIWLDSVGLVCAKPPPPPPPPAPIRQLGQRDQGPDNRTACQIARDVRDGLANRADMSPLVRARLTQRLPAFIDTCIVTYPDAGGATRDPCVEARRGRGQLSQAQYDRLVTRCLNSQAPSR
jgi:hypothetical protein